jgi:ribosomal protein L11 methyltransferase
MTSNHAPDRLPGPGSPHQGGQSCSRAAAPPPDRLYIYYLQGRVQSSLFPDQDCLGTWEEGELSFVFFSSPALDRVQSRIGARGDLSLVDHFQMSYIEWQGGRMSSFSTGPLTVIPAWEPDCSAPGQMPILLDPGVVFGSGLHPTTRDCLRALTRISPHRNDATALDMGTGSGVLAVAAARMGWGRVVACDLNPLAVRTAAGNIRRNGVQDRVLPYVGRADQVGCRHVDLVMANIHFDAMQTLVGLECFAGCRAFILSGLLPSQMTVISDTLTSSGRHIQETFSRDGTWQTCLGF